MKFIDVKTQRRTDVSIPVTDIAEIYDYQSSQSEIYTKNGTHYYCELSRKKIVELINND